MKKIVNTGDKLAVIRHQVVAPDGTSQPVDAHLAPGEALEVADDQAELILEANKPAALEIVNVEPTDVPEHIPATAEEVGVPPLTAKQEREIALAKKKEAKTQAAIAAKEAKAKAKADKVAAKQAKADAAAAKKAARKAKSKK